MEKSIENLMRLVNKGRHFCHFQPEARALAVDSAEREELWLEGYAARFNSPTVLFEANGVEYREKIAPEAFREADMTDVIFNFNHGGKPMARLRNKTLFLDVDEHGLRMRARVDGIERDGVYIPNEEGRQLYQQVLGGYIDRMSFQFTVRHEDGETFDQALRMWTIQRVKKLYDVSAVDIPAYEDTIIEARRAAVLEAEAQSRVHEAEASLARQRLEIKLKI